MTSSAGMLSTLISVIATLLGLAVEVGLLVIALTVVKPRREDAVMPLAAGAGLHLFATVLWPVFSTLVMPSLGHGEGVLPVYQIFSLFLTIVRTVGWAAILFGIVKLAGSAPPPGPRAPWS